MVTKRPIAATLITYHKVISYRNHDLGCIHFVLKKIPPQGSCQNKNEKTNMQLFYKPLHLIGEKTERKHCEKNWDEWRAQKTSTPVSLLCENRYVLCANSVSFRVSFEQQSMKLDWNHWKREMLMHSWNILYCCWTRDHEIEVHHQPRLKVNDFTRFYLYNLRQ